MAFVTNPGNLDNPLWNELTEEFASRGLLKADRLHCAGAEIVTAARLRRTPDNPRVLLDAFPLGLTKRGDSITAVTVASKSGRHCIRARHWIDASDEAPLVRLAENGDGETSNIEQPDCFEQRVLMVNRKVESARELDISRLPQYARLENLPASGQFMLSVTSERPLQLRELANKVIAARDSLGGKGAESAVVCFAPATLPIYADNGSENVASPKRTGNLFFTSPACVPGAMKNTLAGRFQRGVRAAEYVKKTGEINDGEKDAEQIENVLPTIRKTCDVLVAGGGTGGAMASLAALDENSSVIVIDPLKTGGGIGTNGLINNYCHGCPGGMFDSLDQRSHDIEDQLVPHDVPASERRTNNGIIKTWNREAKKIAFEEMLQNNPSATFLGGALVYEVEVENKRIVRVLAAASDAIYEIIPKTVVDATGDGDIAAMAGCSCDTGRPGDGQNLCYSQAVLTLHVDDSGGINLKCSNFDSGWVDATDPEDVSRARLVGAAQHDEPHLGDSAIIGLAPVLGIRQSRQFHTETRLHLDDLISHTRQENAIGFTYAFIDPHLVDYEFDDDETMFWLWGCKNFRGEVYCQMPYGLMLPEGLRNLWLGCRALGVSHAAGYAVRMQRDVQRLGEAAGRAAAMAAQEDIDAMAVSMRKLQSKLSASGALQSPAQQDNEHTDPLELMDAGHPGGFLWEIYRDHSGLEEEVLKRLTAEDSHVSWLAAVVLAMWHDNRAEPRLLAAINEKEEGLPTPPAARGVNGQWIDVPNWFLAVNLLRLCGSAACLPALKEIADQPNNILDLRASIALTMERIAPNLQDTERRQAEEILNCLVKDEPLDRICAPSRSIYRSLRGEQQTVEQNRNNQEDNGWRLDLAITRAARALHVTTPIDTTRWRNDERGFVRRMFSSQGDK